MRVSSLSFYTTTLAGIQNQQSSIARLSQQIANEQKYLATKDAPIDSGRALQLADSISTRTLFQTNQSKAEFTLKEESTVLGELDAAINTAHGLVVGANASLDSYTRQQLSMQFADLYKHIKGLANYQDSAGNYLFAGYQSDTKPYLHDAVFGGATAPQVTTFAGDAGIRQTEIDTGRHVQTNDNIDVVMRAGTADDLLQNLDRLAVIMRDGTVTQADMAAADTLLNTALGHLRTLQTNVSGRLLAVSEASDSTLSLLQNERSALGRITELDTAAAIVELQQRQVSLQAAESAFSLTSKQSLFNYL